MILAHSIYRVFLTQHGLFNCARSWFAAEKLPQGMPNDV